MGADLRWGEHRFTTGWLVSNLTSARGELAGRRGAGTSSISGSYTRRTPPLDCPGPRSNRCNERQAYALWRRDLVDWLGPVDKVTDARMPIGCTPGGQWVERQRNSPISGLSERLNQLRRGQDSNLRRLAPSLVFKTSALNHSATSPGWGGLPPRGYASVASQSIRGRGAGGPRGRTFHALEALCCRLQASDDRCACVAYRRAGILLTGLASVKEQRTPHS